MNLVIDYLGKHLRDNSLGMGCMLSVDFPFNKNKTTGVQELHFKGYAILEVVL